MSPADIAGDPDILAVRPTIAKLKYGQTDDPRVSTVQKLYAHLVEPNR